MKNKCKNCDMIQVEVMDFKKPNVYYCSHPFSIMGSKRVRPNKDVCFDFKLKKLKF